MISYSKYKILGQEEIQIRKSKTSKLVSTNSRKIYYRRLRKIDKKKETKSSSYIRLLNRINWILVIQIQIVDQVLIRIATHPRNSNLPVPKMSRNKMTINQKSPRVIKRWGKLNYLLIKIIKSYQHPKKNNLRGKIRINRFNLN